jgi:ectoine hydroxylase-related dioxygenase (phytanoyl-CoA dioxygenase family)
MLTTEQVEDFRSNGFVNGGKVISEAQADALAQEVLRVLADKDKPGTPQPVSISNLNKAEAPVWQVVNIWEASELFRQLVFHPPVVEAVKQVLEGKQLRLWHDQIQYKPVSTGGVNMWHQDSPYWPCLTPKDQQVTAWIALDDADVDNGCMSMIPGSHQWGNTIEFLHQIKSFEAMPKTFQGHTLEVRLCPVKKGNMHLHHSLTWHGSHANRSGRPRRAIALHYMNERSVYCKVVNHPMEPFIAQAQAGVGTVIEGAHFPLVYSDGAVRRMAEETRI